MASGTALVSEQEYLSTNYKPACDYIDGVLRQKSWGTRKHGVTQGLLASLIRKQFHDFLPAIEVTVKIRAGKYFVPDLIVLRRDRIQDPYPTEPVHLCVEILSPEDRISETFAKCEEYHAWGVETAWVIDPEARRACGSLTAEGLSISMADLFNDL